MSSPPPLSSSSSSSPPGSKQQSPLHDGGFQTLLNFRDVATTINTHLHRPLLREARLYRSARPDEATPADRARLHTHYGLRTVIDLRSKTEHAKAAQKREATRQPGLATSPATKDHPVTTVHVPAPDPDSTVGMATTSNAQLAAGGAEYLIPGVTYREIRVTGKGFERHMLSQLSWWSFLRLVFLYAIGQRMAAIAVLGREVMTPRGLLGLGCDTLDASGPEIAAGLDIFLLEGDDTTTSTTATTPPSPSKGGSSNGEAAAAAGGINKNGAPKRGGGSLPLLIHCTQGKDRTGLMVALVLLICKVPLDAIEYDYELTDEKLGDERDERMAEIREMGLPDSFGVTVQGFVPGIVAHLDDKYGGLDAYLDGIGFGPEKRTQLRDKLLC